MFNGASNFIINDGHFIAVQAPKDQERESNVLRQLEQRVAFGALHNSKERYDAPKCLQRTRVAVLREISQWIWVTSIDKPILWLYGPAGAGKSAIAQSIAEEIHRRDIPGCLLIATFFFNRSNGERNNVDRLIPTLAYQMTFSIPETREYVLTAIVGNPRISSLNVRTQMEKLIIEPLLSAQARAAGSAANLPPMLIIVDGLDECQKSEERTEFIQALIQIATTPTFHLMVLCHSRPESDIRMAFNNPQTSKLTARLVLDNQFNPDSDIRILLEHNFTEIKQVHPLKDCLPHDWPPYRAVLNLVRKSSGQFIYVSTVMKYVTSRRHNPMTRLEIVLNVGIGVDASPFKELDALYTHVLSSLELDEDNRAMVVRILGMICFPKLYGRVLMTPRVIDDVLRLEPGGTLLVLDDLHSLISVGGSKDELRPFHVSFGEFLEDRARSAEYHVSRPLVAADCALAYFRHLCRNIINSITDRTLHWPDSDFLGELTEELRMFFRRIPWKYLLETGMSEEMSSKTDMVWRDLPWAWEVHKLYRFCKMASDKSSTWESVLERAHRKFTAWLANFSNLILSSSDTGFVHTFQDALRTAYIDRLVGWELTRSRIFPYFIVDILRDPEISCIEKIDRQKHTSAIFDTILEGLVTDNFAGSGHCLLDSRIYEYDQPASDFEVMLDSADRTSCIDTLLIYFEEKSSESPPNNLMKQKALDNLEKIQKAIEAYKQKPIYDDYDYSFLLEPSIEVLRARYQEMCRTSTKRRCNIGLSDLGICNFIRLEKLQTE